MFHHCITPTIRYHIVNEFPPETVMSDSPSLPARRIVSSRHLAEGDGWEASELEYGMIIAYNAFSRWMSRCC